MKISGFSFIEILMVFAISLILMFIAIPGTKYFFIQDTDKIVLNNLLHEIQFAQHEAQIRSLPITLCKSKNHISCSGNWEDGQIIFIDEALSNTVQSTKNILDVIAMPKYHGKLYFQSFPIYRHALLFLPNGLMENDNGTFWYCSDRKVYPSWALVLSKSGNLRVVYPDKNGIIKDSEDRVLDCH